MNPTSSSRLWLCLLLFSAISRIEAQPAWTVHEWGTFTSLQNENGETIGGINTDDEPVPKFVHRLAHFLLLPPNETLTIFSQGAPHCHPDVTMRLETPVIYFHPPKSARPIQTASVKVKFRGGWLSEFYPDAVPDAPGLKGDRFAFGALSPDTVSQLEWNGLKVGGDWPLTNSTDHVWTSPRAVNAASVQTTNGESEKFLFYRGVANLKAPLKISRDTNTDQLVLRCQLEMPAAKPLVIPKLWLVDIKAGGKIAFRSLPPVALETGSAKFLTRTPASFGPGDFASANLGKLRNALLEALVAEGLFADEAQALLNTWELSYFRSTGLRVFFIVPPAWTDFYLPLEISVPAKVDRVMVGRIELVTPEQQQGLKELGQFSQEKIVGDLGLLTTNFYAFVTKDQKAWERISESRRPMRDFISVPETYQTYLDLGRFRNALILDEAKRHSTPGLTNFIYRYGLRGYKPLAAAEAAGTAN